MKSDFVKFFILFPLLSCTRPSIDSEEKGYEYMANWKFYHLNFRDGKLCDTSYIYDSELNVLETAFWDCQHDASKPIYAFTTFDTAKVKIDSSWVRPKESILRTLRQHTHSLHEIYNKHLRLRSHFKGRISVQIWIKKSGVIEKIYMKENTTNYMKFANEIVSHISAWRFEECRNPNTDVVTIPFTFSE